MAKKPSDPEISESETPDEVTSETPLSKREIALEEIQNARYEELESDGVDTSEMGAAEEGEEAKEPADEEPAGEEPEEEPEEEEEEEEPEKEEKAEAPDETVKITVDGQVHEIPLSKVREAGVTALQFEGAARSRLNEASKILKDAQGKAGAEPTTGPVAEESKPALDFGDLAEKIQYGEKDDAAKALETLVRQIGDRQVDTPKDDRLSSEQITARVLDTVEWNQALASFGGDFPDIAASLHLSQMSGTMARQIIQDDLQKAQIEGRLRRPYLDLMREAGHQTRQVLAGYKGPQVVEDGDSEEPPKPKPAEGAADVEADDGKHERKRTKVTPPTSRSKPAIPEAQAVDQSQFTEEAEAKSRSNTIQEMTASRRKA